MPRLTSALKSAKGRLFSRVAPLWLAAASGFGLFGCGTSSHPAGLPIGTDADVTLTPPSGNECESPAENCACTTPSATADCGEIERTSGDYVSCSMGQRTCRDGKWGACIGDRVATIHVPTSVQHPQALGTTNTCADNPCDPYCRIIVDNPTGLALPDGGALAADGGVQLVLHEETAADGSCTSMVIKPTPQTLTVTSFGASGLSGAYFAQVDQNASQISPSWVPTATRIDSNIDYDWEATGPGVPGIGSTFYSVRWTGTITAPTSEAYTLCATSDDGVRLWLDDALVVNAWYDRGATEDCAAPINWTAGSTHKLRMEYYQAELGAEAALRWQTASIPKQIVPSSAFVTPGGAQTLVTTGTSQFQIELSPPDCIPGTPKPAWTLDRPDLATVDGSGNVRLISAVSGPITVTAYLGQFAATATLNVAVDITNSEAAPTGSVASFQSAPAGADPARILYPYDKTVLPIGLSAPVIQWATQGTSANAVKVSLQYPTTGAPNFRWSEIIPESTPPQATIPRQIWKSFEQTAKGQSATFSLQRLVGAQPKLSATRTLTFASTPLRGRIYYTQYQRDGGPGRADIMMADPGSEDPAAPAFSTHDGCPVCHTMSASGTVFAAAYDATVPNYSLTLGGISSVNANGSLSPIADFVAAPARSTYTVNSEDWRGFAWAPLTPDGQYALSADNVWGNSNQSVVGIDASRHALVATTMLSGGSGVGLFAQYYPSTSYTGTPWKRIDPQVNFDFGAGSPSPVIPADYSVKRTGQIQAYFSESYKFEVVTSDNVALTVAGSTSPLGTGTVVLSVPMVAGARVPLELDEIDPNGNSNVQLFWSSPSTPRALVPQTQLYLPTAEQGHGAYVTYYANPNFTGTTASRVEPEIASDYGLDAPAVGIGVDNWSDKWDAQVEAPYSGAIKLCVDSEDAIAVTVDGALLDSITSAGTDAFTACSSETLTWTAGGLHTLHLEHRADGGNARAVLSWQYGPGVNEIVPSAYLRPIFPTGYTPPTNGLTATYYDSETFNAALGQNQTNPRAFQRIDPNIDFDFGQGRPNYSTISDEEHYSARWSGQINLPCSGVYEFQSNGNIDGGGRMWIDNARVMSVWHQAPLSGGGYFDSGLHDFKFDWYQGTGGASARLMWRTPCTGSPGLETIPSSAFTPAVSASQTGGFITDGGDNGNNTSYWVWQTPTAAAPTPVDVTSATRANWGLGSAVMMVPTFSPDGSELVFIDGDSGGGAGWRKGLSTWDFDQGKRLFKNRRLIVNDWPSSDVLKWPTFESDSQSVIYQSTTPGDTCCRGNVDADGKSMWAKYGYMGPSNYYEDPGRLWSVDSKAVTPSPQLLTKLNVGQQPTDANKSYQPTMLPVAAGGYRWVVFTSTRPYGNSLNLPEVQQDFSNPASYAPASYTAMTNFPEIQSQLWISAIDDATSNTVDRSHPSFWLPSQNFVTSSLSASGYVNERAVWVLDACHPPGTSNASTCEVDEDCCGGVGPTKTGACRLDTPLANPPTRHCQSLPAAGGCEVANASCSSTAECCSGLVCVEAACTVPPPVLTLAAANYERIYQADCPDGTKPVWRFFDWKTTTPDTNSALEFYAETVSDPSAFQTLPPAPAAVVAAGVARLGRASGAPVVDWTGVDVDVALQSLSPLQKSQEFLKITIRFIPNEERTASPVLNDWRQIYSCVPAE